VVNDGTIASRHRRRKSQGSRNGASSSRCSGGGTRSAVKANTVNAEAAALVFTVLRQLKVNGGSTSTLIIADHGAARVARSSVLTRGAIGHAIDDVQFCVLLSGNVEVSHREAALV
jgi:hypothetical protein